MKEFKLTPLENNERLAAAVTSYGLGTRSYNRSSEKREMDRQRAETTDAYETGELTFRTIALLLCHCRSFRYGHRLEEHRKLFSDHDWTPWEKRAKAANSGIQK